MFGLFGGISNSQIEEIVHDAMVEYVRSELMLPCIQRLTDFADREKLGAWKRARFSVEVICFGSKAKMPSRAVNVLARSVDLFMQQPASLQDIHAKAFECGLSGAMEHALGWDAEGNKYAGTLVADEYIIRPNRRESILRSYSLGWLASGNKQLSAERVEQFKEIAASLVYGFNVYGSIHLEAKDLVAYRLNRSGYSGGSLV
jgi:hypothetical protein